MSVGSHSKTAKMEFPDPCIRCNRPGYNYDDCWVAFPSKRPEWMKSKGYFAKTVPKKERERILRPLIVCNGILSFNNGTDTVLEAASDDETRHEID